ncbi:hypothetical protein N9Z40_01865 [Akkermansiaceae bacterium]|nr:hypothetical protein [Akkermansiaceae bacterium]
MIPKGNSVFRLRNLLEEFFDELLVSVAITAVVGTRYVIVAKLR